MDLEYRKTWDKLVVKLEVVDCENQRKNNNRRHRDNDYYVDSRNEVVHWVMHYPVGI